MASIRPHRGSDGTIVSHRVYAYDDTIGRTRYRGSRKTAKAAKELRAQVELDEAPHSRVPFSVFAERWYADLNKLAPATMTDYRYAVDILKAHFGAKPLARITVEDVEHFKNHLTRHYSDNVSHKILTRLRQILKAAKRWGYVKVNAACEVPNVTPKRKRQVRALEPWEVGAIFGRVPEFWRVAFDVWLATGARISEIFGLKIADCDLVKGTVTFEEQVRKREFVDLKSEAAHRTVQLPHFVAVELRRHLTTGYGNDMDLVFTTPTGCPVDQRHFTSRVFKPLVVKAGLDWVTPHILRHTFISILDNARVSHSLMREWAGHEDISTTLGVYSHPLDDERVIAAQAVGEWMESAFRVTFVQSGDYGAKEGEGAQVIYLRRKA